MTFVRQATGVGSARQLWPRLVLLDSSAAAINEPSSSTALVVLKHNRAIGKFHLACWLTLRGISLTCFGARLFLAGFTKGTHKGLVV